MDWVDYKRHVIRYRKPYTDGYEHIHFLLSHVVEYYSRFRSVSIEGELEWKCVEKYGWFLYYLAELENMTSDFKSDREEYDDNEWGMIAEGCTIIRRYRSGKINGCKLATLSAKWIRSYFPAIFISRVFNDAIKISVHSLREKHNY